MEEGAGLNRTSVGLKPGRGATEGAHQAGPQSNQRGIETWEEISGERLDPRGLNRTSVGLKPPRATCCLWASSKPQSNQRGIETMLMYLVLSLQIKPQSNQRGIETAGEREQHPPRRARLNRTSVGLKRAAPGGESAPCRGPQSNQRGIETGIPDAPEQEAQMASIEPAWD